MKFRERIKNLWKKKSTRYGAAGTVCLVIAGVIFALNMGGNVQAGTISIGNESFSANDSNIYVIDSKDKLLALSDADKTQTQGKKFALTEDINVAITDTAKGDFAGELDGNGHVITITSVSDLASSGTVAVSEGLLFGTVSGKIQNLIVDIQNDVKYTRTSTVGIITDNPTENITVTKEASAPYSGTEAFSSFSSDSAAKELAAEFNGENITEVSGYYRKSVQEEILKTTTYGLQAAQTDQFGILCGTLDAGASIEQVYVKGTGSLIVQQYAGRPSNITTQSGTRDKYFYYKKSTGSYTEEKTAESASVTASAVTIYNSSAEVSDTSDADDNGVKIKVSAPKYIAKNGNLAYKVQVTNGNAHDITINSISANSNTNTNTSGTLTDESGSAVTDWTIAKGNSQTYVYTIPGVSENISGVKFTLSYTYSETTDEGEEPSTESKEVTTKEGLSTTVVDTSAAQASGISGTGLQLALTPGQMNYLSDGTVEVTYTLTMANNLTPPEGAASTALTINPADITFKLNSSSQSISWTQNGNPFSGTTIAKGGQTSLKGTLTLNNAGDSTSYQASVTVQPSSQKNTYENVAMYQYVSDPGSLEEYGAANYSGEPVESSAENASGNHLNAGIIAGTSNGSITKTKQDMQINGSSYDGNTADLNVGGIIGAAVNSASASDLYILGTQNYAGENSNLPDNSVIAGGTKPANSAAWTSYTKYESDGSTTEDFDLAWLVKAESSEASLFTYTAPDENEVITVGITNAITSRDLSYTAAYNARKSMADSSEDAVYVDSKIDFGKSGYYRLLNVYATDGYYHYTTPVTALKDADFVYPYAGTEAVPYGIQTEVARTDNPLDDKIEITLLNGEGSAAEPAALNGTVYYEINSTVIPTENSDKAVLSGGTVSIPFEVSPAIYHITPVSANGHIYPTKVTDKIDTREPLPQPTVTCFNYYGANGTKNTYTAFTAGTSYEAGTDMLITPTDDKGNEGEYTIRYKFSEGLLESSNSWGDNHLYTGMTDIMSDALEYTDSAVIPDSLAGNNNVYLYVEISKKNYDPVVYYYGSFPVTKKVEWVSSLNGSPVGETDEERRVLDNDVVTLTLQQNGTTYNKDIQYMVTKEPTISFKWTDYMSAGITMKESLGGYIYARYKLDEDRYSEPQLFDFIFGDACASPIVTPNTGLKTSGEGAAASIEPTTQVGIASRTSGAEIFYLASEVSGSINMERIASAPSGAAADAVEYEASGYKYFKVENRWYRTSNKNVQRYTEGFYLSHTNAEATYMYVTAVAIAGGYDISDELEYIYKVRPPQQVKNPEAAFETRFTPGGEEVETSTVSLEGKVTFYTVTPGASLYYAVGSDESTEMVAIPSDGVTVTGNYGGNFVVRVQAREEGMLPSEIITFVYKIADKELANAPTATPGTTANVPTTVIPGNKILLSTTTKGAAIFYTTDGSTPLINENEDGTFSSADEKVTFLYDSSEGIEMPTDGSGYFTITAVAVKSGLGKSPEARFVYAYPETVLAPYANIDSGKVELNTQILLKNLTEGAVIYYNAAYGSEVKEEDVKEPTLSSTVFSEEYPFAITQKTIIKAMAAKDGVKSSVVTFTYDPMAQLAAPTASIETGSVVSNGTILHLSAATGATIYYTIDGSDPTDATNTAVMSGSSITLNGETGAQITIKAYAKAADSSQSEVVTFTYQFSQNATGGVTANIASGSTVSNGTKVILMTDVTGADIYYTTDGDSPITDGIKGTTVEINGTPGTSFTIKAVAMADGEPGMVSTFIYRIKDKPDAPTASPAGGTLTSATRVSLNSGEDKIYYTTDGTDPTKSSNLYSEPILINRTTTLKAIAVSDEGEVSDVAVFQYNAAPKAGMPKSDQESGQVLEPGTKITLWSDTKNATIYYTTDGTEPTINNLDNILVYDSEGVEINRSVTIKAVAYTDDMQLSNVSTWTYTVEIIPAVEIKKAEAEKLAEEGLHDTDASALERKYEEEENTDVKRVLKEKDCGTMLIASKEFIAGNAVLYAEEKEINPMVLRNAKTLFGDEYTVLSEYDMWLKSGKTYIQPTGEVEIAIPIPEGYENATLTLVEVDSENKLTTLETKREDGMLYAATAKVNEVAVVGLASLNESDRTFPYLVLLEVAAGVVLLFGGGYYIKEKMKKHKKGNKDYPNE